jgi:hypothetical protein
VKELLGKLSALDPEASDTLRVIGYFDTLVEGRVSIETLVRGAATLAGTTVCYRSPRITLRVHADGRGERSGDPAKHPTHPFAPDSLVWMEREGHSHANDAMVLERLAIAIAISRARSHEPGQRALELLFEEPGGSGSDHQKRLAAAAGLHFSPHAKLRAIALPIDAEVPNAAPSATIATPWGLVRGIVTEAEANFSWQHAGIGVAALLGNLPHSWRTALIALRLSDSNRSIFRAEDLGPLLTLVETVDARHELHADVLALEGLAPTSWSLRTLQAIADGSSLRTIAAAAGLHHSSVQAKLPELARMLGYDPLTPLGRTRMYTALILQRLARTRFYGAASPKPIPGSSG